MPDEPKLEPTLEFEVDDARFQRVIKVFKAYIQGLLESRLLARPDNIVKIAATLTVAYFTDEIASNQ